ncbi:hypothetical protein ALTERO38_51280 [Alteromonas sp. 38]|uniref:hypothetical protein n=1 Tax=Alteromonas TaxID=226 RepID=UPI0012F410E0|nr:MULTISPECIES: hypothetical protein [Alteromonas]CAD5276005.1 hypothetical protein ALTER154_70463 [Alteromonas sp. 154]VXB67345.1 hypothetical protein ALTERO38_51280 [Alteromonas sp. 38]
MDDKIVIALISGGAALGAAIVTGLVAKASAKEKTKQIESQLSQQLQNSHFENARSHLDDLYIPIGKAIALFESKFRKFHTQIDITSNEHNQEQLENMVNAIADFEELLDTLRAQGAEVFMIPELEELVFAFASFLRESLNTSETIQKAIIKMDFGIFGFSTSSEHSFEVQGSTAAKFKGKIRLPGMPFGFALEADEILAAPIISQDFINHVSKTLPKIKASIKIVTLGPRGLDSSSS